MEVVRQFSLGRSFLIRVPTRSDLLHYVKDFAFRQGIRCGTVSGLGATTTAKVAYYHQDSREYEELCFDVPMEIVSIAGNISIRDGEVFPHLHIMLSDRNGTCFGGHLNPGTIVYAAELAIQELLGTELHRGLPDEQTGLRLWI